jgi:hypothetical protein
MTFIFNIQLMGVHSPDVWRKLRVPANCNFDRFHNILQAAFGWYDMHLHEFSPERFGSRPVITHPASLPDTPFKNSLRFKLSQYFKSVGDKIVYTYDFGDGWEHQIVLESISDQICKKASCLDGGGMCPPEDCGGIHGFEEFKKTINNPKHEEYVRTREWVGIEGDALWNVDEFDKDEVSKALERI